MGHLMQGREGAFCAAAFHQSFGLGRGKPQLSCGACCAGGVPVCNRWMHNHQSRQQTDCMRYMLESRLHQQNRAVQLRSAGDHQDCATAFLEGRCVRATSPHPLVLPGPKRNGEVWWVRDMADTFSTATLITAQHLHMAAVNQSSGTHCVACCASPAVCCPHHIRSTCCSNTLQ